MNFFKKTLKINNYPFDEACKTLNSISQLDLKSFEDFQELQKWKQFNYFIENNNFYNSFVRSQIGNELPKLWSDIPIIKKKDIQKPLETILSKEYKNKSLFKNSTSGSTGNPFFFAKDKFAHAMTWALIMNRYSWYKIEYGKSLQARFYGIPLGGYKYYIEKLKDLISARVRFPVFDLSDKVLNSYIEIFKTKPFEYINGYAASLVFFAGHCIKRGIILKDICPTLKICIPTSETCTADDREILQKGFGVKVVNEYGCAEMDVIAFDDNDGDWIVSDENVFIEIVDDDNKPLPNGSTGKILLTTLYNRAIPLIRYEVGDLGALKPAKKGNFNVLDNLSGRTNDFAVMPNGRKVPALTFYYVTKTLIKEHLAVKEFIIKQISLNEFIVEYAGGVEFSDEIKRIIKEAFDKYLQPGLNVSYSKVEKVERGKTGKFKQFISLIK
jgi:phenylacetate-CoA ligase